MFLPYRYLEDARQAPKTKGKAPGQPCGRGWIQASYNCSSKNRQIAKEVLNDPENKGAKTRFTQRMRNAKGLSAGSRKKQLAEKEATGKLLTKPFNPISKPPKSPIRDGITAKSKKELADLDKLPAADRLKAAEKKLSGLKGKRGLTGNFSLADIAAAGRSSADDKKMKLYLTRIANEAREEIEGPKPKQAKVTPIGSAVKQAEAIANNPKSPLDARTKAQKFLQRQKARDRKTTAGKGTVAQMPANTPEGRAAQKAMLAMKKTDKALGELQNMRAGFKNKPQPTTKTKANNVIPFQSAEGRSAQKTIQAMKKTDKALGELKGLSETFADREGATIKSRGKTTLGKTTNGKYVSLDSVDGDRTDEGYGVWFSGRRTPGCVEASDRAKAIIAARKNKRRGGENVVAARVLTAEEKKAAKAGRWIRTGPNGEKPGKSRLRGQGPRPNAYA